ncbi:uncharacterized protein LOC134213471 [Armigeres subalbatus]|uniref:uncharacterized protein LOC134213471 n=1 Tax=Armigeres subalbatus TaxID=124917 RepID=UPI002ED51BA9
MMKSQPVWIIFVVAIAIADCHYYTPLETHPQLPEDLNHGGDDSCFSMNSDAYLGDLSQDLSVHTLEKPNFMNYQAPPNSVINYIPVEEDSWITPNVHVDGQGYFTDRYVAPTMLKRFLSVNPR